jgi:hypothetical protein
MDVSSGMHQNASGNISMRRQQPSKFMKGLSTRSVPPTSIHTTNTNTVCNICWQRAKIHHDHGLMMVRRQGVNGTRVSSQLRMLLSPCTLKTRRTQIRCVTAPTGSQCQTFYLHNTLVRVVSEYKYGEEHSFPHTCCHGFYVAFDALPSNHP